jgi:hypothetical protein
MRWAFYDPATQRLSPEVCAVPFPNMRDLKVLAT